MARSLVFLYAIMLPLSAAIAQPDKTASLSVELTRPSAETFERKRDALQLTFASDTHWRWQLQHDYRVFELPNIETMEAASNGHVHQLALAWITTQPHWHARLQPTLATSSNALRHNELHSADLRWQGELFAVVESGHASHWQYGVRADDRFGRYQLYPSLLWRAELASHWHLQLGWPDTTLSWQISADWSMSGFIEPTGGEWHVYDQNFNQGSALRYQQWQLGYQLHWRLTTDWQLSFGLVHAMRQEVRYRLLDNQQIKSAGEDHNAAQFSVRGQF